MKINNVKVAWVFDTSTDDDDCGSRLCCIKKGWYTWRDDTHISLIFIEIHIMMLIREYHLESQLIYPFFLFQSDDKEHSGIHSFNDDGYLNIQTPVSEKSVWREREREILIRFCSIFNSSTHIIWLLEVTCIKHSSLSPPIPDILFCFPTTLHKFIMFFSTLWLVSLSRLKETLGRNTRFPDQTSS